jgi:uncharacterized protein
LREAALFKALKENDMRFGQLLGASAMALASVPLGSNVALAEILPPSAKAPTVAIGAEGREESVPDIAMITAGLETSNAKSDAAMAENNRNFAKIMDVVRKYGIDQKDMQTAGVGVRQDFDYKDNGEAVPKGFIASNSLSITARDLSRIGDLIADLVAAGANSIVGPTFAFDDNEAIRDKAREKAFDNAQRRAMAYARKAGFKSVRLLTINEAAGEMAYSQAAYAGAMAAAADAAKMEIAPTPIEPGLVTETVYASFLFEMVP